MGCCYFSTCLYFVGAAALYFAYKYIRATFEQKKLDRWSKTPKDVVILHGFPRATTVPNGSPFVLKLQTYLRMANIQHKMDAKDYMGPKGKSPWISLNGEHVADSELIVEFLQKKFEKKLNGNYSEEQLAIGTAVRVMLEEHAFWGAALERFVFGQSISKIMKNPPFLLLLFAKIFVKRNLKKQTFNHGIGRHSEQEIVKLVSKDIRVVSKILGNKKFILGDEPCIDDCAIFGMLAQFLWGLPDSPYERLVKNELPNLKEYCLRMKEKFFPDWEQCIAK